MNFIFGILTCIVLAGVIGNYLWRPIISYNIEGNKLKILFCKLIPLFEIPKASISNVEIWTWAKLFTSFDILWLGNRIWGSNPICIFQDRGLFRKIIITPKDPDQFVKNLLG